jgi:hypothetical protein
VSVLRSNFACTPVLLVALVATTAFSLEPIQGPPEKRDAQKSHLQASIPADADFDRLMLEALTRYFTKSAEAPTPLRYELLRKGATLAGVSSPKYYAWITLGDPAAGVGGAVRLAAKDGNRFEVMNYFTTDQIRENPAALESVFPKSVIASIQKRVEGAE